MYPPTFKKDLKMNMNESFEAWWTENKRNFSYNDNNKEIAKAAYFAGYQDALLAEKEMEDDLVELNETIPQDNNLTYEDIKGELHAMHTLPEYFKEKQQQFCLDMYKAGLCLIHYEGRSFYKGPAVVVNNVDLVKQVTKISTVWNHMGKNQFVVYPVS